MEDLLAALRETGVAVEVTFLDPVCVNPSVGMAVSVLRAHFEREEARVALVSSDTEAHLVRLERAQDEEPLRVVLASPPQDIRCRDIEELRGHLKDWTVAVPTGALPPASRVGLGMEPWRKSIGLFGSPWELDREAAMAMSLLAARQISKQLSMPVPDMIFVDDGCVFVEGIGEISGSVLVIAARIALEFKDHPCPIVVGGFK